jgi:hypothetical protein
VQWLLRAEQFTSACDVVGAGGFGEQRWKPRRTWMVAGSPRWTVPNGPGDMSLKSRQYLERLEISFLLL